MTSYGPYDMDNLTQGISSGQLSAEIEASSIVTALDQITTSGGSSNLGVTTGGTYTISFKAELSSGGKEVLDGSTAQAIEDPPGEGSLLADHAAIPALGSAKLREDGVMYAVPKPSTYGMEMCDRDFRVNTCLLTNSYEDLKVNTTNNKEEDWNELSLVNVYKDVAGTMTPVTDQADADLNGILSVWDYAAKMPGTETKILYELKDGGIRCDPNTPDGETWDHRAYAVVAPTIPGAYGGSIAIFDGYLGLSDCVEALSPQATVLDPAEATGASVFRLYLYHPAGSKLSHVLRLVMYRSPGTY